MRIVRVAPCFDEPAYASFTEAVDSANERHQNRVRSMGTDFSHLKGRPLSSARWTDRSLTLLFGQNTGVTIAISFNNIECRIEEAIEGSHYPNNYLVPIHLLFDESRISHIWDRQTLIGKRHGCKLKQLFFGKVIVFVYFEESPILLISRLRDHESGEDLLYWDDCD
jgi:hypothetical protein